MGPKLSCGYEVTRESLETSLADARALATAPNDPSRPLSYASARSIIRGTFADPPPVNERTTEASHTWYRMQRCVAQRGVKNVGREPS